MGNVVFDSTAFSSQVMAVRPEINFEINVTYSASLRKCMLGEKLTDNYACVACPKVNQHYLFI